MPLNSYFDARQVNNFETCYNVVFDEPRTVTLRVNNAFAAKAEPVVLPEALFAAGPLPVPLEVAAPV